MHTFFLSTSIRGGSHALPQYNVQGRSHSLSLNNDNPTLPIFTNDARFSVQGSQSRFSNPSDGFGVDPLLPRLVPLAFVCRISKVLMGYLR